ncbi:MAG TPA: thiamine-phosphate kinase [Pyrinomonadaceae bacterium]|jgi:thiamine-monophosphate kinase
MKTEFEFITNLKKKSAKFSKSASRGKIGDDCAVLPKDANTDLVITADLLIEDVDFRLTWAKPEFIGYKALAVSLSDVAAMGAKPVWAMVSIGVPEKIWKTDFVEKFYSGWFRLAKKFDVELVGGDVSKTPDKIVIDSIAAGEMRKKTAVLRSGARVGDLIFVSGNLGGAAAGLRLLEKGERFEKSAKNPIQNLLVRQLKPKPNVEIGQFLGRNRIPSAMIDLSDGLSSDLAHICRESKVGAKIFADKIPFDKNLNAVCEAFEEKLEFAANGGEDFELLFTVNPKYFFKFKNTLKRLKISLIGEATANIEIIELIDGEKSRILQPEGFRHF